MTSSGEPPSGVGGVNDSDWIDQILERATEQVMPIVPIVPDVEPVVEPVPRRDSTEPLPAIKRAAPQPDGLAEIRWVDTPQVTPASTPIASPQAPLQAPGQAALTADAVGRSAYDEQLRDLGGQEPDGWDQLSWQDLDDKHPQDGNPLVEQTSFGRLLREWGPVLFAAVAIALFTRLVLIQAYHIPSESMVPTLERGDRVVVNRLSYQFGDIERGQVVVLERPPLATGSNDLIKRVIALPGEEIRFDDNKVFINGLRVEEPYLAAQASTGPRGSSIPGCSQVPAASDRCVVPEGYVFVMGDNRRFSSDSRVFGPVEIDTIVGRAFLRVWPLNSIGEL